MVALGKHILAEFYECDADAINDVRVVEETLLRAAREAKATVIGSSFHLFEPHGVSGVVVISESHLAIHSWPEYAYAAVDIFTCGEDVDPMVAFTCLKEHFGTQNATYQIVQRGQLGLPTLGGKQS
ncbi:MAG TPA: S-adenosylmethionine decarboxylase proenzyme [Campylobacteraceae bacterium]|nr:S-adenosylmethionine decarboxylase proenzyme [Campylobacteraceae bacterium]